MEYSNYQRQQEHEISNGEASSVRPRWTPKQEQIAILESIYNSGVVNPPKDETTRIRKLLEDYGPIVDANVFYWFQNRRSRSRRRTRQIQAKINREQVAHEAPSSAHNNTEHQNSSSFMVPSGEQDFGSSVSFSCLGGGHFSSSSYPGLYDDNPILYPNQVCYPGNGSISGFSPFNNTFPADTSNVNYQSGMYVRTACLSKYLFEKQMCKFNSLVHTVLRFSLYNICFLPLIISKSNHVQFSAGLITVFINGAAAEVPMGPLDMKLMFGEQDLILFHSSGIQVSDTSFSSSLQHGESYFLVHGLLNLILINNNHYRYFNVKIPMNLQVPNAN